ncbi:MAG: hypothetical protein FJY77_01885, partial [Candidatus Altiarchaeales archaeon]|nr:hypothetical protein [Candidatus Altiarchaeales archaeon]
MFFVLLALANAASAENVDIDGISVDVYPGLIRPGEDFKVGITFDNPDDNGDSDVDVKIWVGGVLVHDKEHHMNFHVGNDTQLNISSSDFDADGDDIWSNNLMNYECNDNIEVKVEVSGDVNTKSDTNDNLDLLPEGDEDKKTLEFTLDPENPLLDEDITIIVKNAEGDEIKGAKVKFTWIDDNDKDKWEENDDNEEASTTDNDGETTFNIADDLKDEYGKYQIDVWKSGYCKAIETINVVQGELTAGNPEPSSPKVGEQFKIKITDGTNPIKGAKAVINELGVYATSTSKEDGYLSFLINREGTFTIFINASGYGQIEKQVTVSSKPPLTIVITPTPQEVNGVVSIVVMSNSDTVSGVTLTITKPEGGKEVKTTNNEGKVTYTPNKAGQYTVLASKDGYQNSSEPFIVSSAFNIQTSPEASSLFYGSDLTITVYDATTNIPVSSALISGTGVAYGSRTNSMGQFTVKLENSGQYNFLISKDGYGDKGVSVIALCRLELRLNTTGDLESGRPVLIRIYDKEKKDYVSGNIAVFKPDGTSDTKVSDEYVLTPTQSGSYRISISKANCQGEEKTVEVTKRLLRFETELQGNQIIVKAVSGGMPVSGIELDVTMPSGTKLQNIVSDQFGM